jgi:molybdenum cofactor biosynthesis protein B
MARVVTVTVSDAHQGAKDASGPALSEAMTKAGHTVLRHETAPNDAAAIRALVERLCAEADAVVLTGGTGLGPKDVTVETVEAVFDKRLDGFGEAFRRASWDQIGPKAILSRATAGVVRGCVVFALPGSTKAVTLGAELLAPILDHAVEVARGRATRHA